LQTRGVIGLHNRPRGRENIRHFVGGYNIILCHQICHRAGGAGHFAIRRKQLTDFDHPEQDHNHHGCNQGKFHGANAALVTTQTLCRFAQSH